MSRGKRAEKRLKAEGREAEESAKKINRKGILDRLYRLYSLDGLGILSEVIG